MFLAQDYPYIRAWLSASPDIVASVLSTARSTRAPEDAIYQLANGSWIAFSNADPVTKAAAHALLLGQQP